nr:hypothetical protein [Betaproteobacteria bacterium]
MIVLLIELLQLFTKKIAALRLIVAHLVLAEPLQKHIRFLKDFSIVSTSLAIDFRLRVKLLLEILHAHRHMSQLSLQNLYLPHRIQI